MLGKRRNWLRIFLVAIILSSLILVIILFSANNAKNATLNLILLPYDNTTATINGKNYKSGSYQFYPDENIEITIKAKGYETKKVKIKLPSDKTTVVSEYLLPNEASAEEQYIHSDKDIEIMRIFFSSEESKRIVSQYDKAQTLKDYLPIQEMYNQPLSRYGSIAGVDMIIISDATTDQKCTRKFCIAAKGYGVTKEKVKKILSDRGFDIDNYEVIYDKN